MQNIVLTKVIFFIMNNWYRHLKITASIAAALLSLSPVCMAGPAIRSVFMLTQPDGTTFSARLRGDEFMKILTTADGCAISQDEEGWYRYASYADDGTKTMTDYKVGKDTPVGVLAQSRIIPYRTLTEIASVSRMEYGPAVREQSLMARTRAAAGIATKSQDQVTEKHGIVILAQFSDLQFQSGHTRASFVSLLTQQGYSLDGADGSAMDYFNDQFSGYFTFSFDVSDIVTLSHGYAYYGQNVGSDGQDARPAEMVSEACRLADSQIDFSKYDDDGDGEVDNVFIFFAGGDEAEGAGENHIWSHAWYVKDGAGITLELDGKKINRYACTAELRRTGEGNSYTLAGIGTFCHEFSHTLGLSDYYDTDYEGSGGMSDAMWGSTALMDAGNSNNNGNTPPNFSAAERDELGIYEPEILTAGTHVLEPVNIEGKYYKMETGTDGEYFLFECRAEEGWDRYIGGSGLLIYHIDKSGNASGYSQSAGRELTARERWDKYEVNCNPDHQCADLIEALSTAGNVSQVFFPYSTGSSDINAFTPLTDPAFVFWDNSQSPLAITSIERSGDNIILTVNEFTGEIQAPSNVSSQIYQDAAIITWEASSEYDGTGKIRWKKSSGEEDFTTVEVEPYDEGKYSCTIDGLTPLTPYKCEIFFESEEVESKSVACNFTTKSPRDKNYPFIYLYYMKRNDDGTFPSGSKFPLRMYNAYTAEKIVWYMDGKEISVDGSGFYTPSASGELKAEIFYEDGSKSIVTKTITIK